MRPSRSIGDLPVLPAAGRQRRRRTDAADLDIHRQAEADEPALRPAPCRARLLSSFQFAALQRRIERLLVVARVVDGAHLRLVTGTCSTG